MPKFTHSSGSRPLDGYVIKRGIGQGGFGEVYYALSDGGKEVALKLVRGNEDIELRGMAQCLNLKHQNLVALYDIKTDSQGNAWIVMEYVAGECLSDMLNRNPRGLPLEQARLIFIELARAIGHLHDNGIVHRDLKPGNIFIENGTVKVGDYGLCKFMSGSTRSPQTQSVGTVHYMAPEISTGNYGKQIDIYAAGIILYEMITGKPPFDGETAGEVLMKHLTATPDLSKLPPGYAAVIGKALAKDPNHRYRHIMEMVAALEADATPIPQVIPVVPTPKLKPGSTASVVLPALPGLPTVRERVQEACGSLVMSVVLAGLCTLIWAALARPSNRPLSQGEVLGSFQLLVLACWSVLVPAKLWESGRMADGWSRRTVMLALGVGLGVVAAWINPTVAAAVKEKELAPNLTVTTTAPIDFHALPPELLHYADYACFFGIMFFVLRWWTLAERQRSRRFSLLSTLWTGCVGLALFVFWQEAKRFAGHQPGMPYPILLALTAAITQVASPWSAPLPKSARKCKLRLGKEV